MPTGCGAAALAAKHPWSLEAKQQRSRSAHGQRQEATLVDSLERSARHARALGASKYHAQSQRPSAASRLEYSNTCVTTTESCYAFETECVVDVGTRRLGGGCLGCFSLLLRLYARYNVVVVVVVA